MIISNKEVALLGLLYEKPKHAYEIELEIRNRDMRYWTDISISSVYKLLNKLEKRNLLTSNTELSKKNVAKKIYSVTQIGIEELKEKLRQLASEWQPSIHPIDIALANLNILTKNESIELINRYEESLVDAIKGYKELENYLKEQQCHFANLQLATRRVHMLEGEKKWVSIFKEKINKMENTDFQILKGGKQLQ